MKDNTGWGCEMNVLHSECVGRWRYVALSWGLLLLLPLAAPCGAQDASQPGESPAGQISHQRTRMTPRQTNQHPVYQGYENFRKSLRTRQLIAARQKVIARHMEKLLKLATELNAELADADSRAPTAAQLRKIEQIRKLAHSIRNDIGMPTYMPIMTPIPLSPPPAPYHNR